MPSDSQSIGDVPCYSFTSDGLILVPTLPYAPEHYARPNPFIIPERAWEQLDLQHKDGMTYRTLAEAWGTNEQTVYKTLRRYRAKAGV